MVEDWKKSLDSKKEVITMFLDLSKAFDTVDHQLLIHKLKFFTFKYSLIKLIENYLTDRSIKVNINNTNYSGVFVNLDTDWKLKTQLIHLTKLKTFVLKKTNKPINFEIRRSFRNLQFKSYHL